TKRTVTGAPLRERSTSECCLRSSKRRVVMARSSGPERNAGAPLWRRRRRWRHLCPPERLFGLIDDIAPGLADVVQFAVRPLREFAAGAVALPPDTEGLDHL